MNATKVVILVALAVSVVFLLAISTSLFETNSAGYYQVKQAAISGVMSVREEPGVYPQMFGDIFTYHYSGVYYFSKHELDGGGDAEAQPITVRFNDGATAQVSGSLKFKLSSNLNDQLLLHQDFKSYQAVADDLVRQVVTESLMQTATLMKAEESYSSRRSEFTALAEDQVKFGIFDTVTEEMRRKDVEGNDFIERTTKIRYGEDNKPIVRKPSSLKRYNIDVLQFVIKDIDFDETVDALIAKKKEAEQLKVVARANAERAKQDAITAEEQGKANVATARAAKEVEKIEAVTSAEKEFQVAELNKKRDQQLAEAELIKQRANAEANRLLVNAGLTPLERATIEKETAIGVAAELAKVKLPGLMVIGGDKSGNQLNPFDAVGLKAFHDLSKEMSENVKR
jgi:regulator of protease activity HflC (stomatin/prohibitin superfamily)